MELELTYFAASLPDNLQDYGHKILKDIYFPADLAHPKLRIRQKGGEFELIKRLRWT